MRTAPLLLAAAGVALPAQNANYDEAKVPSYRLPEVLRDREGNAIADPEAWARHRPELLHLLEQEMFGPPPTEHIDLAVEVAEQDDEALGGRATRWQLVVRLGRAERRLAVDLLVYVPNDREEPAPAFLGLNFKGNHTIRAADAIRVPTSWMADDAKYDVTDHLASPAARGRRASRWPVDRIVARGFALATAYYGDIDPDYDDGFGNGLHALLAEGAARESLGSIGAWAYGLSRLGEALRTVPGIDAERIAVFGHSRLGKTALWAGAQDQRFWLTIANDSGCGGAALSRRRFGETLERITRVFPHWFTARFATYAAKEDTLPFDQHQLIALIAPRPVYVASASEDLWADPRGEFLAARAASPVYALFGLAGLEGVEFPDAPDTACGQGAIGYHLRAGRHDVTSWDWDRFMDFADRHRAR